MKYFGIILSLILLFSNPVSGKLYSRLEFKRDGGGNKEFYISRSDFKKSFVVNVTRYNFKDTTFTFNISGIELSGDLVNVLISLFNGRLNINGDFKQSKLPTGTWAHFYLVDKNSLRHEILNKKLRDTLFRLESIVENKIKH
jgi:hypothetical protein